MSGLKCLASRDDYKIGLISALPIERAAALVMLDEKHGRPLDFEQPLTDSNFYAWGRMGDHNVVTATLPAGSYGTTSAATTALPLLSSFPQIRLSLMVGIGAGVPKRHDIRLGDVAISQPSGTFGGVVQYDSVKAITGQNRKRRGYLNSPPAFILKALSALQAQHEFEAPQMYQFLQRALEQNPRLTQSKPGYGYQGIENDRLFEASYSHVNGILVNYVTLAKKSNVSSGTSPSLSFITEPLLQAIYWSKMRQFEIA